MTTLLVGMIGGARRSSERWVSCPCSWWIEVGGEEVIGWEVWVPEVAEVVCEDCGETIKILEGVE